MTTNHFVSSIEATDLVGVTGGGGDPGAFTRFVDDNAKATARRFDLVQRGQLDREDFKFFLQNQQRAARILADR